MEPIKIQLAENEIPRKWYNLIPDLPNAPLPPLGPDGKPVPPEAFSAIFPANIIEQEVTTKPWIDIPDEIIQHLLRWRPTPLRRAHWLEQHLKTPAKIYYKDESVSPGGSHKLNTAIAQAWYNKQAGTKTITTETGAGQWGSALSLACELMGIECKVFMVKVSYEQKPFRKMLMRAWGGSCVASPSMETEAGRSFLEHDPDSPGTLGMAISEAVELAVKDKSGKTKYALGSVMNHVMLHQTIIGLEAKKQLASIGIKDPDIVIGCVGGGSNFSGLAFPFTRDKINGANIEIIPCEPTSCPSITKGLFAYDFGDASGMTPLMAMHTLGHSYVPKPIHAGGLRYHGMSPIVSQAVVEGLMTPRSILQLEAFQAGITWARTEGFVIAPETTHAVAAVIQEAIKAREEGKEKTIVFTLSGHGLLDLNGYDKFLNGELHNYEFPAEDIAKAEAALSQFPPAQIKKSGKW
ncbi:MAG TPA: TrpB-like pyridoxal phosphate-dependent enzyme [Fibrobacteraceae bacterium]|nr:TrpB-like pyridoxal phosphate-dependent enzyme [Fibrobacteraceae bacterium]